MADLVTAAAVNAYIGSKVDTAHSNTVSSLTTVVNSAGIATSLTFVAAENITQGDPISLDSTGKAKIYTAGDILLGISNTTATATNNVEVILIPTRRGKQVPLNLNNSWSLKDPVYLSESFDFSAQITPDPSQMQFNDDGTIMYISKYDSFNKKIFQYTLSTPYDITTASYASKVGNITSTLSGGLQGFFIGNSGTKVYAVDNGTIAVFQFTLSTAWDISTISYDGVSKSLPTMSEAKDVTFKPDGTKMFIVDDGGNQIEQHTLSTPWAVNTAGASTTLSINTEDSSMRGVEFKPDGLTMFMIGATNDKIYKYTLSTAWDITTAVYTGISFSVTSQDTQPESIVFKPDGSYFFVLGRDTRKVYKYQIPDPAIGNRISIDSNGFLSTVLGGVYLGYKVTATDILVDTPDAGNTGYPNANNLNSSTFTFSSSQSNADLTVLNVTGSGTLKNLNITNPSAGNLQINSIKITADGGDEITVDLGEGATNIQAATTQVARYTENLDVSYNSSCVVKLNYSSGSLSSCAGYLLYTN